MPIKTFAALTDIPEALRADAVEMKDGRFAVADEEGLKTSQQRLLDEKKGLAGRLEALEQALGGRKPEDIAARIKASETAEEEAARKAGKFDELMAKREAEIRAEYEPKVKAGEEAQRRLIDRDLDVALNDAMAKSGVLAEDMATVRSILKATGRVKLENGKTTVYDTAGDPTGLTLERFFAEPFRKEGAKFYDGSGSSGGGANNNGKTAEKGAPRVSITDERGFLANLDSIAAGTTPVTL